MESFIENNDAILVIWTAAAVFGYFLGSIPFGFVLSKIVGGVDLRNIGSKNIGATNVLRTGKPILASLTLFADTLKGSVSVYLFMILFPHDNLAFYVSGIFSIIGHSFPVWLNFQGGKGVATSLGVILVLNFPLGLGAIGIWVATLLFFQYSSLAALVTACCMPFVSWMIGETSLLFLTGFLSILIFYRHKTNIRKLFERTEPTIKFNS